MARSSRTPTGTERPPFGPSARPAAACGGLKTPPATFALSTGAGAASCRVWGSTLRFSFLMNPRIAMKITTHAATGNGPSTVSQGAAHPGRAGFRITKGNADSRLVALVVTLLVLTLHTSHAAITYLGIRDDLSPDYIEKDVKIENDVEGAIFNSGLANFSIPLAEGMLDLPGNQGLSIADLTKDWNVTIRPPTTGDVYTGWDAEFQSDGSLSITRSQGAAVDTWAKDKFVYLTIQVPKSQLEYDGIPGYDPLTDASIVLSSQTMPNAFVGYEGGAANISHSAEGQFYQVQIPEPRTYAFLFGLVVLGMGLRRRFRKVAD